MKGYTNAYTLKEQGWEMMPIGAYPSHCEDKRSWVARDLEPTIIKANCGWESVTYVIMQHGSALEEYVILAGDGLHPFEGRYIHVSANSLGAILSSVAENLW